MRGLKQSIYILMPTRIGRMPRRILLIFLRGRRRENLRRRRNAIFTSIGICRGMIRDRGYGRGGWNILQ